ncbi:MAG: 2-methylcitrate synthase/citrate synthase II [Pirellulaceae bacterium]|jgi:2-methylcitrate synthase/citrate synthase II
MGDENYYPGLEGVIAGETSISTVANGLSYRGYPIDQLVERATFEQVSYLLLYGQRPNAEQDREFRQRLVEQRTIDDGLDRVLELIPRSANTMDFMRSAASLLSHWSSSASTEEVADGAEKQLADATRLLASLPVVLANRQRRFNGQDPVAPREDLGFAANFLWMLDKVEPSSEAIKAMDVSLILYAEHEFNASTFTARVVTSTRSDLYSAITAAIGALKGALHGGANERVMEVLAEVGSPANAEPWIRKSLADKNRIMGFGHRVYKTGDPRAKLLKPLCARLAEQTGNLQLEAIADTIESIVWEEKKLPPNLDWPSARLYHYLNLPVHLYTPLFVLSRVVGWSAHVIEQAANNRLIRPRSKYVGTALRDWT